MRANMQESENFKYPGVMVIEKNIKYRNCGIIQTEKRALQKYQTLMRDWNWGDKVENIYIQQK